MANVDQGHKKPDLTAQEARQLARERLEEVYIPPVIRKRDFPKYSRKVVQRYRDRKNKA